MSVKEFWEDNPDLFWAYRFSYFTNLKNQQETFNQNAWLQGAYFYNALQTALANCFGKEKVKYLEKPFSDEDNSESAFIEKQKLEVEKIKARVTQVQAIIGQNKA